MLISYNNEGVYFTDPNPKNREFVAWLNKTVHAMLLTARGHGWEPMIARNRLDRMREMDRCDVLKSARVAYELEMSGDES